MVALAVSLRWKRGFVVELRLNRVVDGDRESGSHEGFIRPSGAKVGGWNKRGRWGLLCVRALIHPVVRTNTSNATAVTRI